MTTYTIKKSKTHKRNRITYEFTVPSLNDIISIKPKSSNNVNITFVNYLTANFTINFIKNKHQIVGDVLNIFVSSGEDITIKFTGCISFSVGDDSDNEITVYSTTENIMLIWNGTNWTGIDIY